VSLVARNMQRGGNDLPGYSDNLAAIDVISNELQTSQHTAQSIFYIRHLHLVRVTMYDNVIITRPKATVTELLTL
jgi:hypothetical protein